MHRIERDNQNASKIYSLDRFKERYDEKLRKAYLEGRYGAVPIFADENSEKIVKKWRNFCKHGEETRPFRSEMNRF